MVTLWAVYCRGRSIERPCAERPFFPPPRKCPSSRRMGHICPNGWLRKKIKEGGDRAPAMALRGIARRTRKNLLTIFSEYDRSRHNQRR